LGLLLLLIVLAFPLPFLDRGKPARKGLYALAAITANCLILVVIWELLQ
jgi:hypothetical protein